MAIKSDTLSLFFAIYVSLNDIFYQMKHILYWI